MRRGRRIQLVRVHCKRCGKEIYTASRSLFGLDDLKRQYGSICEGCFSPEEKNEMMLRAGRAIAGRVR